MCFSSLIRDSSTELYSHMGKQALEKRIVCKALQKIHISVELSPMRSIISLTTLLGVKGKRHSWFVCHFSRYIMRMFVIYYYLRLKISLFLSRFNSQFLTIYSSRSIQILEFMLRILHRMLLRASKNSKNLWIWEITVDPLEQL
jgi:hypothetical protein